MVSPLSMSSEISLLLESNVLMNINFGAFRELMRHDFHDKYYGNQDSRPNYFGKWPKPIGYLPDFTYRHHPLVLIQEKILL